MRCFIRVFLPWKEVPLIHEVSDVYTSPFLDTHELKRLYGPEKFPGFSKNGPRVNHGHALFPFPQPRSQGLSSYRLLRLPFLVSRTAASGLDRLGIRLPSKTTKLILESSSTNLCKRHRHNQGWNSKVPQPHPSWVLRILLIWFKELKQLQRNGVFKR